MKRRNENKSNHKSNHKSNVTPGQGTGLTFRSTLVSTWLIVAIIVFSLSLLSPLEGSSSNAEKPPIEKEEKNISQEHWVRHLKYIFQLREKNLYPGTTLLDLSIEIGLSEAQQQKIEQLMLKHQESVIRKSAEIKITEMRFARFIQSGKLDRQEAAQWIRSISEQKTDLVIDHMNYLLDLRELLTPDQIKKLSLLSQKKIPAVNKKSPVEKKDENYEGF